jgi:hypothetical protein
VHIGAAHLGSLRAQQRRSWREIGTLELPDFYGLTRRRHHRGQDAIVHARTLPCRVGRRISFLVLAALAAAAPVSAQDYSPARPRKHFITIGVDWLYTQPLHFDDHPLSDLAGTDVATAQFEEHDYETRDGATRIDVIEFSRRQQGASVSLYPLGLSTGAALTLRGSIEQLPRVQIAFDGPAPISQYVLTDGRAFNAGIGVTVADRSPGWGLGSHAFVVAGIGRITSGLGDGRRFFAEGGGGLGVGPFGVELGVKFAWNTLSEPVEHKFLTVPITLRGTLTF